MNALAAIICNTPACNKMRCRIILQSQLLSVTIPATLKQASYTAYDSIGFISGGASYGAKGLKPLLLLLQPLQNFCVKQYIVSVSIFLQNKIKIAAKGCHILRL